MENIIFYLFTVWIYFKNKLLIQSSLVEPTSQLLSLICIRAEITPKKPTVPLFIFVRKMIYGKFVRARVGNRSPIALITFTAIVFLWLSMASNFFNKSKGGIISSLAFKELSS